MQISLIYILISAEILLVLLGLCITLAVMLMRKPKSPDIPELPVVEETTEANNIDLGISYIDYLEQAMLRNTSKLKQQQNIEADVERESILENKSDSETDEDNLDNAENNISEASAPPDEKQSLLLQAREQFLTLEKEAEEKTEHDIHFWDHVYNGMQDLLEQFKSTETITETDIKTVNSVDHKTKSTEKVFYIETQGKKVDGEVNKLKDIIYEQENALNSMKKAIQGAEDEFPEDSETLAALKEQLAIIERQLSDSKMCMEVLEMENDRLQEEVDKLHAADNDSGAEDDKPSESSFSVDIDQIREISAKQEAKIQQLLETIESLEMDSTKSEQLTATINEFSHTSREMMSCITILEEENEHLLEEAQQIEAVNTDTSDNTSNFELEELKSKISSLEEEIIKKDVAFAKLQDEFDSMETEYLAMYEAMHGDGS